MWRRIANSSAETIEEDDQYGKQAHHRRGCYMCSMGLAYEWYIYSDSLQRVMDHLIYPGSCAFAKDLSRPFSST
jgi:hypothetical protein